MVVNRMWYHGVLRWDAKGIAEDLHADSESSRYISPKPLENNQVGNRMKRKALKQVAEQRLGELNAIDTSRLYKLL